MDKINQLFSSIVYKPQTQSTNDDLRQLAADGAEEWTVVVAAKQTAGRGRMGREWQSSENEGLYMSLLLRPKGVASTITLLAGLSVLHVLFSQLLLKCTIKWPNDVLVHGKKICGILAEGYALGTSQQHLVLGIGINLNQRKFCKDLSKKATSVFLETGQNTTAESLILPFLTNFYKAYENWQAKGFADVCTSFNQFLHGKGEQWVLHQGKNTIHGTVLSVNDKGELLFQTQQGNVMLVSSGEVSLRGTNGYV